MGKAIKFQVLELPEFLTPTEMESFMNDPNVRAQRRTERLKKLGPVAGKVALRGYKRDWLNITNKPVERPDFVDPNVVKLLSFKLAKAKPLTDQITRYYDINPYPKSAESYGRRRQIIFLNRIAEEERNPERIKILEQGATRSLEHVRDNLQINLWRMTNIARLRLAHIDTVLDGAYGGKQLVSESVKQAGWAVADLGYCLRVNKGVLKNIGQPVTTAINIENTGDYIADGHSEAVADNLDLILLTREEQARRAIYWHERYEASIQALGRRLPDQELAMEAELDYQIKALYSQQSDEFLLAA